jgi:hypothetical protein
LTAIVGALKILELFLDLSDDLGVTRLIEALDELGDLVHGLWWRESGSIHDDQVMGDCVVFSIMSLAPGLDRRRWRAARIILAMAIFISQGRGGIRDVTAVSGLCRSARAL